MKIYLVFILALFIIACSTTAPQRTKLMNEFSPEDVTAFDIRIRLNNFALLLSSSIENTADQIIASTNDPVVKENALLWKMNSIPIAFTSLFYSDPLAAGLDTWAFTIQMDDFFKKGNGQKLFKEHQGIAVKTSTILEQHFEDYMMEFNSDTLDLRPKKEKILNFAQANPINDLSFYRRSVIPHLGEILSKKDLSIIQSLGTMEQALDDIRSGLTIYSEYLPKQARWQAEFLIHQTIAEMPLDTALSNFSSITRAIERLTPVIEKKVFVELDRQRRESFKFIEEEKEEVFDEIERERQRIFEDLRKLIREEVHNERVLAFKNLEIMIDEALNKSMEKIESPIDHFFIRLLQYTILLGILAIVLLILKPRFWPNKKS
jgi:hypothetical protein